MRRGWGGREGEREGGKVEEWDGRVGGWVGGRVVRGASVSVRKRLHV